VITLPQHQLELHRFVLYEIPNKEIKSILDCGCGRGIWGYLIREKFFEKTIYLVGVDLHKPYLEFCKKYRVYDDLVNADISALPFRQKSFDIVIGIEVIEHIPKEKGASFLEVIESIAKKKVIITTPNGYKAQGAFNYTNTENHRSGWQTHDFKKRNYRVHGIGIRLSHLCDNLKTFWWLTWSLYYILTPLAYIVPQIGDTLLAIKTFPNKLNDFNK